MSFHFIFVTNFIRDKNPLYGILHKSISTIYYIYHCLYGTRDTYRLTSSTSNFIFTVGIKILVKPSVLASKL